jgi:hypothetical protein
LSLDGENQFKNNINSRNNIDDNGTNEEYFEIRDDVLRIKSESLGSASDFSCHSDDESSITLPSWLKDVSD